jgi:ABC-2 type transport system permease protein
MPDLEVDMHIFRLIPRFIQVSFLEEAAYRSNFFIGLFSSILNLATGILGIVVLFSRIETINGWTLSSTLTLLGVYLIVSSLRGLFIGPGFEALAGMEGDIWSGKFDFTLLRPLNTQLLVSFHKWRLYSIFDLVLGIGVLIAGVLNMKVNLTIWQVGSFLIALFAGVLILYAVLLTFSALVFWSPGVLFTWIFDGLFQMARYPMGMYPGWLQMVLTWVVPVGLITTVPAEALTGVQSAGMLAASLGFATVMLGIGSLLFRKGLRRYASASS